MADLSMEERLNRVEAELAVNNLMGKYQFYLAAGKFDDIVTLFAQKTPGGTIEVLSKGVYEGIEGVRQYYADHRKMFGVDGQGTGWISEHNLTSSVVEVAKDGKTAKGVWAVAGLSGGTDKETGKARAWEAWDHTAAHFVIEDGKWKIWRMHVYAVMSAPPFEVSRKTLPLWNTGRQTTYHRPYNPDNKPEYVPAAPEPYDTYDANTPLP